MSERLSSQVAAQLMAQLVARPCVLVFAGLDPSGGAGIAADLQAVAGQGAHALTVATALTVQDNDRVYGVQPVDGAMVLRQAQALVDKMTVRAVKIGIPGSAANALAIAEIIGRLRARQPELPVVLDPVLASGHGDLLSRDDAVQALAPLLPLVTVLTPNGPEALALTGAAEPTAQAQALRARGCRHVLITGGHGDGEEVVNRWFGPGATPAPRLSDTEPSQEARHWSWPRLAGEFHGSGCTLASAIAGQLALGMSMERALELAQQYCYRALRGAYTVAAGQRIPQRLPLI
ncbi:bifunctional hydroxymethylpyrimidine kinase/phosphomethylpyrimidine kinase [Duganella violaceipulchra]|uniref:hydroxymethylpyrimidine kinase n=1 Tax=Duganella violaceipulchra TaxID=2849652 RepID=A0AA41HCK9_9BURK|nr:hydroxymethylpyrimidine/phosphomethylpyrimidine kinase [Duganella violaceicalia]MBV6324091.1 hydroxymethylpyrimidine/phosphomethylpyrimidine kinase [Duganella violaceicalia]MCP2011977.1 hydroxymethylpyrimidine/phosphomethylpyrimidine kinase [Duganella violaceicalia]